MVSEIRTRPDHPPVATLQPSGEVEQTATGLSSTTSDANKEYCRKVSKTNPRCLPKDFTSIVS